MFDERLKNMREARGLTQKEISEALNINPRTYASYEKNEREPNSEILILFSKYFGVTVDYLLGLNHKHVDLDRHEEELIQAYRDNPDMRKAVDRLLKIEQAAIIKSFRAANSFDNHEPEIVEMQDLSTIPESDSDEI